MSLFRGPNGQVSAARVFCAAWLGFGMWLLGHHDTGAGVVAWQAVALGLVSWAGGQHLAAALAPQIGAASAALSSAVAAIAKRREASDHPGTEPTA